MSVVARPGRPVPGCGWIAPLAELPVGAVYVDGGTVAIRAADQVVRHAHPVRVLRGGRLQIAPLAELPVGAVYADGDTVAIRAADQVVRHAHPVRVLAWTKPDCPSCLNPLRFDDTGVETFSCHHCEMMWPADYFTSVAAPSALRLPSPVHHEDNPLCACIPAYLERDLTDPQCPLDVAVEAVEAATGLVEHRGVWGPPPTVEEPPGLPRHTEALLDGDRTARITFRPARTDMVASDLWDPDDMPDHPTAQDVAALAGQLGRDDVVRLWALAETITVTVAGPEAGDFTSTTI